MTYTQNSQYESNQSPNNPSIKICRIYIRASTDQQDTKRQHQLIDEARAAGFYVAGVYEEKASGARSDRPELLRLINDLQAGETVIAEKMDRISRLPLPEAESLINSIKEKGAKLAIPGVVDFSDMVKDADGITKIVLESVQEMLLKLALQMARDDYETRRIRQAQGIEIARSEGKYKGRKADEKMHQRILCLRKAGNSIAKTAELAGCSISQVKKITALYKNRAA